MRHLSILRRASFYAAMGLSAACLSAVERVAKIPACPAVNGVHPSSGSLRVLPSEIPGVTLDSMRWSARVGSDEFEHDAELVYNGRIVATHEVPLWDIGVLYEWTRGSHLVVDRIQRDFNFFLPQDDPNNPGLVFDFKRARPERPAQIWFVRSVPGTKPDSAWGCPRTARVIRTMNIATHAGLTAAVVRDSAARLAALRAASGRPLQPIEILVDTVLDFSTRRNSSGDNLANPRIFSGVAVNTTADSLHDAAIWYAIDFPKDAGGPDTVVYWVGDVAPHAIIPFGGGSLSTRDQRTARGAWRVAERNSRRSRRRRLGSLPQKLSSGEGNPAKCRPAG